MKKYRISGVPITEDGSKEGRLVGILTNRDLRFETNLDRPIADIMTRDPLFTVPVGTTLEQAREFLHRHKVEKLLVVDDRLHAQGADHRQGHPEGWSSTRTPCKDSLGRLRVRRGHRRRQGCARSAPRRWSPPHVDVLVVDTAHGHSQGVLDMVARIRRRVHRRRPDRRQRRHRRGDRGADRPRGRRGQGRHRRRLDLHDPRRRRHRRADDHRDRRLRARRRAARRAGHRRRRHPLLGRHHQGDCGRRAAR